MAGGAAAELQHPRRSLGNRHRAQAEKFLRLAERAPEQAEGHLAWAEQAAQQAVLHDFTHPDNWWVLARTKAARGDGAGMRAVLDDIFTVLGRDPEHLQQLEGVDLLELGGELLLGALAADPLDADEWWTQLQAQAEPESELAAFADRCAHLDFRDQRATIVFGRRLERMRAAGDTERFLRLAPLLLSHRPTNHELWLELGRLHEGRKAWDEAWLCYDHVQQLRPQQPERDAFRQRLEQRLDASGRWKPPSQDAQARFHERMLTLARRLETTTAASEGATAAGTSAAEPTEAPTDPAAALEALLASGQAEAAFFQARRLLAEGESWAAEWVERAQRALGS